MNTPVPAAALSPLKHRADYQPPVFLIPHVGIAFDLDAEATTVTTTLHFGRNPQAHAEDRQAPLVLNGEAQTLLSIALNDAKLAATDYHLDETTLTLSAIPDKGTLTITSRHAPAHNTALEGLYLSSGVFCTQCEAEGFRRITYFPDRPDVLSRFDVTLRADSTTAPVLLSNGNLIEQGALPDGRHYARWQDPFPKPCYLFALVAGDLDVLRDAFTTCSGRNVTLEIYSTAANIPRCTYAMGALKSAMRWDETRYRREYDLDRFMIFCADDFNMGAMENKGLNIFNSRLVLADPQTATDDDYHAIESVIGHEYFHNWTGDRVTCRDWFQLSLKEGLTVFRDQQFSSDMGSAASERIAAVDFLRKRQFPEDAGPTAHPVRPDEYREINNFYTMTVYEKGAEVIRMQHTLLGEEKFQRGMDLYFERHDGHAVTCDDFVQAMQDASGIDLTQFRRWYSQAGTPVIKASDSYDAAAKRYTLTLEQHTSPTPGQPDKQPLAIPVTLGLLDAQGHDLPLAMEKNSAAPSTRTLMLNQPRQSFHFENIAEKPVPSLLRGGSAPARLEYDYHDDALQHIARYDSDPVNRWDAMQRALTATLISLAKAPTIDKAQLPQPLPKLYASVLEDEASNPALRALALTLPDLPSMISTHAPFQVKTFVAARRRMAVLLSETLHDSLVRVYERHAVTTPYAPDAEQSARRKLRAHVLALLCASGREEDIQRAAILYRSANGADGKNSGNMTDTMAALTALRDNAHPLRDELYADFEKRWRDNPLVLDKWFALQASSDRPDDEKTGAANAIAHIEVLMQHPAFTLKNPNRVRAVLGSFALRNTTAFHAADGSGYRFITEKINMLDSLNPHIASMLVNAFSSWKSLAAPQRNQAQLVLQQLMETPKSSEVSELLEKLLAENV